MSTSATCRFCGAALTESFCDLGLSPLANSYVSADQLDQGERFYPLHAYVCSECYLVQLAEFETPEQIFGDYAYFSSFSRSWLEHARTYVEQTSARFDLGPSNQIVEIASNDGYLLQYFVERGLPGPRHRAGGQRRGGGAGTRDPDAGRVLRHRARRRGSATRARLPTCCSATTCSPTYPTSTTSSAAWPRCSPPTASSPWSSRTSSS